MKPQLFFADDSARSATAHPTGRSSDVESQLAAQVGEDLGLSWVVDAMADGDTAIADTARTMLLSGTPHLRDIAHRQAVLADCVRQPELAARLYELAGRAVRAPEDAARGALFDTPESILEQSRVTLTVFVQLLRELRSLAEHHGSHVESAGFARLFALVEEQFDEAYLSSATDRLEQLRIRGEMLVSARLGTNGQSHGFALLQPVRQARGLFRRGTGPDSPSATYVAQAGDEASTRALAAVRDAAIADLAGAVSQSAQHVTSFFAALRAEVGFYLGCLNLRQALVGRSATVCVPVIEEPGSCALSARGLYDVGLQLRLDHAVVTNDVIADGKSLIMVTGANRGGKSTFLRSVGLAQLMAAAGMFVAATAFTTSARDRVYTHFARDEDTSLTSGKLDEELRRMSLTADVITPRGMLLCNESFQSTNEREGSDIARHILDAMTAAGVCVVFVTHLYALAQGCYDDRTTFPALFLRAEPGTDAERSFRLHEAAPSARSHGADLWGSLQS